MRLSLLSTVLSLSSVLALDMSVKALDGLIHCNDKRYLTFQIALELCQSRGLKTIVETGTSRNGKLNCGGDGCSTVVFSQFSEMSPGVTVESVDISEDAVREAAAAVANFEQTTVHLGDSVKFLADYERPIDFLYLDSYDFDASNPAPSQQHHLKEIIAAYSKLHEDSIVMVDDCGLPSDGKCPLVELFLHEMGWRTIVKGYQLIMVTGKPATL